MVEHDPVARTAMGVQDAEAFREACAIFGTEEALARLRVFCEGLEEHLSGIEQGHIVREDLREFAHQTAGRAGVLGFPALVDASARLEEAIRGDTDVETPLACWTEQARFALESVSGGKM